MNVEYERPVTARPSARGFVNLSRRRWLALVALCAICGVSSTTLGQPLRDDAVRIAGLRAGFDGHFKIGYWTPFDIVLEGGEQTLAATVELTVLDGDAVPSRVSTPTDEPVTIPAGEQVAVRLYAKLGQLRGDVTVAVQREGQLVAARRFAMAVDESLSGALTSEAALVVMLGATPTDEDRAHFAKQGAVVTGVSDLDRLPSAWYGYEGVDLVMVATGDPAFASRLAAEAPPWSALDQWVRMGGTLILSTGAQAKTVLAESSPFARLAPGRLKGLVPLYQSTMLEAYVQTSEPLETAAGRFSVEVPQLADAGGVIEVGAGKALRDLPLVVRTPHGFGQVVWLAFDLEQPPLAHWRGRAQLLEKLWTRSGAKSVDREAGSAGEVTTLGFDDLAGQLKGALDQFEGVAVMPFWLVAALVVVYIACIGPFDYYLVTRVLRRPEATWITLALTVLAFSVGAYALAYGVKGRQVRLNQVELVDFDVQSRAMRGTAWANLFSPRTESYDLRLATTPMGSSPGESPRELLSWWGLSGRGFGGMNATAGNTPLFTEPYDISPRLDALARVPIAVWSTKAFVGRYWAEVTSPVEAHLAQDAKLTGTLESRLDTPLENCVLLYDRWAYPIRRLAPGRTIDLETVDPQTVDTYLRHMTVQGDRNVTPPYDRSSLDVPRIVEMMSSHALAGGERYTMLAHEYQGFTDLSGLVRVGRAVLVGRTETSVAQWTRDGVPLDVDGGRWTYLRFVFPVETVSSR
jgi:hypothetical protein